MIARSSGTDSTTRSQRSTASSSAPRGDARRGGLDGGLVAQAEPQRRLERRVDAGPGGPGMAREAVHAITRERVLGRDLRAHQPGTYDDDIHVRRS